MTEPETPSTRTESVSPGRESAQLVAPGRFATEPTAEAIADLPEVPSAAPDPLATEPTAEGIADLPEVLSKSQAAWLLRVTEGVLTNAVHRGQVPATPIGRQLRFSKTKLLAMFAQSSDG